MNKDTIKKRILQKLNWTAPKELYKWKDTLTILRECGYKDETFCREKRYDYRDAQSALREITQETTGIMRMKLYLVPPVKEV